ncbi:hypothetical protein MLD38_022525 [Melastoma candidum]|uniref:Uncharacterized protein n=1 Tax=Melastoma candidum TaxID=119954 RepID=A0ACB9QKL4_9MYRT|nr:hypothetical protein MLD38_022525 [Melastoma candidum]
MKKVVLRPSSTRGSSSSSDDGRDQSQSRAHSSNNVRWTACQKNHAASTGGHSLDGCTRFIPGSGPNATYTCASCGCHRNFHKKEEC